MENLEFESINNFRIASSVDSIVGNIESSKTSTIEKDVGYDDDYIVQSKTTSFMWIGTIILSFFICYVYIPNIYPIITHNCVKLIFC